jgi:monofunctional glycosyltransferase
MWTRLLVAIPLALVGAAWLYWLAIPWPVLLLVRDPGTTAVMRQRIDEARDRDEDLEIAREWVPLDRISSRLQRAVIVAEDGRFREHDGIDWNALREEFRYRGDDDFSWFDRDDIGALLESLRYYRENRDKVRGRSTITQQLAKNLYYSTDRSVIRKLEEFVVARRLETFLSKDRILELYLNVVEWGPGIFGAEAAARHYFGRSAADLSADQAAALAATLPHPLSSNPNLRPGRMQGRKAIILARMGGRGPVETVPLDPDAPRDEELAAPIGVPVPDPDDTVRDSVPPDTIRPDTVPRDTIRRDTLPVDTLPPPDTTRTAYR